MKIVLTIHTKSGETKLPAFRSSNHEIYKQGTPIQINNDVYVVDRAYVSLEFTKTAENNEAVFETLNVTLNPDFGTNNY